MNYKRFAQGLIHRPRTAIAAQLALGFLLSLTVLWGFEWLAEEVMEGETRRLDTSILLWVHSTFPGWLNLPMRLITALGYYWVVSILLVIATYFFYRANLKLSTVLLLISTPGAMVLATVLKAIYHRARPELFSTDYTATFYSFPSGHATVAVGFYGTLALLVAVRYKGWQRWLIAAAGVTLVLLIGFSRLYLGVHYPSDIVGGYAAATVWVATVALPLRLWYYSLISP